MFDELYPEAADLALKTKINRPPTAPKAPEFSTWGMFRGLGTGLPAGAAQGIASTGEMLGAFGTTLATTGGSAGGMFQLPTEAEQKQSLEATDKLIKGDELFAGGEVTRSFRNAAEGYKPDPTTTHTAEQVVFNFARVGGKAITAAMTMGNVPGAIAAGAEEGFTQAEELKQQGVDIGTRTKVGAVTAVTNAVGFALPVAGKTWLQTAGLVAVGGPGTFVTQQAATKAILENANYADLAKQYDPTDKLGLAMSVPLPGAFGALAMRGAARAAKAKGVPPDMSPVPGSIPEIPGSIPEIPGSIPEIPGSIPDAAPAPKDYPDADLVDAARVSLVRQHMDAANPMPDNVEAAGAHNAAYSQALDQVAAGERVAVADVAPSIAPVAGKATDTPNFKAWFGDSKVVDDTGAPMVVYHGTSKAFDSFKNPYAGKGWEMFSDSPQYAENFALERGANIIPTYVAIKNPLDLSTIPARRGDARVKLLRLLKRAGVDTAKLEQSLPYENDLFQIVNLAGHQTDFVDHLKAAGIDGIKMPDVHGDLLATTYIAFDPKQIKSAIGNSGKFDPNSASLTDNPIADWGAGLNRALEDMAAAGERVAVADVAPKVEQNLLEWGARETAKNGEFVKADYKLTDSQPIYQMREMSPADLYLPELDSSGKLQPEKRGYLPGYIERAKAGEIPPAITAIEMEDGRIRVVDGHRRAMAAKEAGNTIRVLVSPLIDTPAGKVEATAENIANNPIAGKATDTPNFKAWFGDSRVVDEQGAPLVLYHGTASDVAEFDASRLSAEGIHLSASPDVANTYANSRAMDGGRGANVVPVYAKADRVLDVPMITTDTIRQAAADGFDAVRRGDHVVVMRPEQIKSAIGNSGKFDPNSASLTDNPMADWGAGVNRALAEMAKTEPKPAPALADTAQAATKTVADQVSALKAQRGAGTKPFELVAQAVENMRTGTKVEAPKPKTPTEARFADLQARNPDVMDKPMQFDVDENGNAAGPATTAREYLERIQREADQDTADASLIEVAANCFLSGGM